MHFRSGVVCAREANSWTWIAVATVDNIDLGTTHVKLRTTWVTSRMQADMLKSQEILSTWSGRWDWEGPLSGLLVEFDSRRADRSSTLLPDLEPVSVSVPASNVGWSTSHIGHVWTGMDNGLVDGETNLRVSEISY